MIARIAAPIALVGAMLVPSTVASSEAASPDHPRPALKHLPRPVKQKVDRPSYDPHAVLVRFKPGTSAKVRDGALRARKVRGVRTIGSFVKVQTTEDAAKVLPSLRKDPAVADAVLDHVVHPTAVPNDYYYGTGDQKNLDAVRLPAAWNVVKDTSKQIIAVLDTGVYTNHPDLRGHLVPGYNAAYPGQSYNDVAGHGTMVAGVAGANTNNGEGIAGASWAGRVMPVRVFRTPDAAFDSDIAAGMDWAMKHGAKIINLSLGGPGPTPLTCAAIQTAKTKPNDVLTVVAAGNDGITVPSYPAACPGALAVGATDNSGNLTDFSTSGHWVDVVAPGWGIVTTYNVMAAPYYGYAIGDGTSFSSPLVAGVAAIVRTRFPTLTADQIAARLTSTARDAGPPGFDPYYGHGLVDAYAALGGTRIANLPAHPADGNDLPATATAVGELPTLAGGTIRSAGDVDWYKFDLAEAATFDFGLDASYDANRPQNFDPVLSIYDDQLRLLGEVDTELPSNHEFLSLTLKPGLHYIAVRNYSGAVMPASFVYEMGLGPARPGLLGPITPRFTLSAPRTVAIGEVTGDTRPDVLMTNGTLPGDPQPNDNLLLVFPGGPTGGLTQPVIRYSLPANRTGGPAVLDATGDGRNDVAFPTTGGVSLYRQGADGVLSAPVTLAGTAAASQLVARDIDADGDSDLVAATAQGIKVFAQDASHAFTSTTVSADTTPDVEAGDVDGDGRVDIVGSAVNGPVRVYHHSADGTWNRTEHAVINPGARPVGGIEVADVNGDDHADVLATINADTGATVNVFLQSSAGELGIPTTTPLRGGPRGVEAGDLDGDGRNDLVIGHPDVVSVMPQNASGVLTAPATSRIRPSTLDPQNLAVGDINGDGHADVAFGTTGVGLQVMYGVPQPGPKQFIRDVSPTNLASGAPLDVHPVVTFERDVAPASVTSSTIRLLHGVTGNPVSVAIAYDEATKKATITPAAALQDNTPYRILIDGVSDPEGSSVSEFSTMFRTVDLAPSGVTGFAATGGYLSATLRWKLPAITDLSQVIVRRSTGGAPPSDPTQGVAVYAGTGTSVTASGLGAGGNYIFRAWVKDRAGKLSPLAETSLDGTRATIARSVSELTYGGTVTLSGKVTLSRTGAALPGVAMKLYARQKGSSAWRLLRTATSSSTGTFSFGYKPSFGNDFQWRWESGSGTLIGTGSPLTSVGLRPAVTAGLNRTTAPLGTTIAISGSVNPKHPGGTVYLQRLSGSTWSNVTSSKLSSSSIYSFHVKPTARGSYTYRVVRAADTDELAGISPARTFRIT